MKLTKLLHRSLIRLSGTDKVPFLQGLVTNDVTKIASDSLLYTLFLTSNGRFLFDLFIFEGNDGSWLIDCERVRVQDLIKRLSLYKLRSQVEITDVSDRYCIYALWDGQDLTSYPGQLFQDPRLASLGYRLYSPVDQYISENTSIQDYEQHRMGQGVPDGSLDMPTQKAIPLEYGMDELNAIDWHKGCYMGQELTARTKHQGIVRKRLFPVTVEGNAFGNIIMQGDLEVGELGRVVNGVGLALIRLEALNSSSPLMYGQAVITIHVPGWMDVLNK